MTWLLTRCRINPALFHHTMVNTRERSLFLKGNSQGTCAGYIDMPIENCRSLDVKLVQDVRFWLTRLYMIALSRGSVELFQYFTREPTG